jgi:hypothetical protein
MMKTNPSMSGGRVHAEGPRPERPWRLRVGFWLLLASAAFYLVTEHRAHIALGLPYLPFLILVACPLIHVFGHGGHGGYGGHGGHSQHQSPDPKASPPDGGGPNATDRTHRHGGDLP